jgi:hypothetical protein
MQAFHCRNEDRKSGRGYSMSRIGRVGVSNLEKVLFPGIRLTRKEIIEEASISCRGRTEAWTWMHIIQRGIFTRPLSLKDRSGRYQVTRVS